LKSGDRDFEIHNGTDTFNVVWIDSCAYRVSKSKKRSDIYRIIEVQKARIVLEKLRVDLKKDVIIQTRID
jgi:hypothetical protein